MKLHILRLTSVAPYGVGSPEAGTFNLIYSHLLQEFNCNKYSHILINQIGDDLDELIIRDKNDIHINIRFSTENFEDKSTREKNGIRLDIIHTALVRIAEKENKLDIRLLEEIKNRIIKNNFIFDFIYKSYADKKNHLIGSIHICPLFDRFYFYFSTVKNGEPINKIFLYDGKSTDYYIPLIFNSGKWKNANEFIIKDKKNEVEQHIYIAESRVEIINLTNYKTPPFYELMKAGEGSEEVYKDWLHSLPLGVAGIISHEPN